MEDHLFSLCVGSFSRPHALDCYGAPPMCHNLLPYFVCRESALLRMVESLMFDSPYLKPPHPQQEKKKVEFQVKLGFFKYI